MAQHGVVVDIVIEGQHHGIVEFVDEAERAFVAMVNLEHTPAGVLVHDQRTIDVRVIELKSAEFQCVSAVVYAHRRCGGLSRVHAVRY